MPRPALFACIPLLLSAITALQLLRNVPAADDALDETIATLRTIRLAHEDLSADLRVSAMRTISTDAIVGESAGGNLAVSTAIAVSDAGLQAPRHIFAVYPVAQTGDMMTPSYVDSATAKPLNKAMIGWFVDKLLAKPADKTDSRLDLVHANLAGLPATTIINAEIDPLRRDGEMLEAALTRRVSRSIARSTTG